MKIGIFPFQKYHGRRQGTIGSSVIRGEWLVDVWDEAEIFQEAKKYDAIIFQKVYWKKYLEAYDGIKILDLCDPDWLSGDLLLKQMEPLVDAFTCSSQGLADFVEKIVDKPVYCIPDRVNLDIMNAKKEHKGVAKRVGWFGYYHNAEAVLPYVIKYLDKLNLELLVISNQKFENTTRHDIGLEWRKFDWQSITDDLLSCDMILNPPIPNVKKRSHMYKTNNKSLISWALGIPVASNLDELKDLMGEKERIEEAEKKLKMIKEEYDVKLSVKQFKEIINKICQKT